MKLIEQGHEVILVSKGILSNIEVAGRTCYKSEAAITDNSSLAFVHKLIKNGHEAMIEFGDITVRFTTNRGVTHELVRHRLCSFAQESTRYVRYDGDMEFIKPVWWDSVTENHKHEFELLLMRAEQTYKSLLNSGWTPQQAREVLPNALKTEIVVKANVREWRHIFKLRGSKAAHPQMRALVLPLLEELKVTVPTVFEDIY